MATISKGNDPVTLVNVFTVEPENEQRVVDLLIEATEKVIKKQPGFISANIHKSLDGVRVVNYAQWKTEEDFKTIFKNPDVIPHMQELKKFSQPDFHLYEVAFIDEIGE